MAPLDDHTPGPMAAAKSRQAERVRIVKLIGRAWEAAQVSVACQLCGEPHWSLIATDSADGVAVPLRRAGEVSLESCYLAYAVECKNCGHVRRFRNFHSARPRAAARTTATSRQKKSA